VSSANELQAVDSRELLCDLGAEEPTGSSRADLPSLNFLGIRPHQIAEGALMRNLLVSGDGSDLIDGADVRREASVDTENLAVNESGEGEVVEDLCAIFPGVGVAVLLLALIVEAVHLGDLPALVVTPEERDLVGPPRLQGKQEGERLETVVATIDEVAHENVVGQGDLTTNPEELQQVVELTVDVTADGDGSRNRLDVGLLEKELLHHLAQLLEVLLRQVLALLEDLNPLFRISHGCLRVGMSCPSR